MKYLKLFDQHGPKVSLTINDKSSYQIALGGLLTIISRLGIFVFFLIILNNIRSKEKTITISTSIKSPTRDFQSYYIGSSDFDIAFGLTFSDNELHLYEKLNYFRYYDIRIQTVENNFKNDSGIQNRKITTFDIPLINCTLDRFAGLSHEIVYYGINQPGWFCPENISFKLEGQFQGVNKTRFRLVVDICQNTTANNNHCASYEQIQALASASRVQIATLNSYFDEEEYEHEPVKRSLNVDTFPVAMSFTQSIQRQLRKITINTKDNWISSQFNNKQYTFYQDILGFTKLATSNTKFILFSYGCDSEEHLIARKVFSLSDAVVTVGGFAGMILIFTRVLVGLYSSPLLEYEIIKQLYQYEFSQTSPENEWQRFKRKDNVSKIELLKSIINKRRNIQLQPLRERCYMILSIVYRRYSERKSLKIYQQGIKELKQSLDIIKIVKGLKRLEILERIVLSDYQRKLIKYSYRNMITLNQQNKIRRIETERSINIDKNTSQLINNQKKSVNQALIKEIIGFNGNFHKIHKDKKDVQQKKYLRRIQWQEQITRNIWKTNEKEQAK